jgi:hypothetical protein
VSEQPADREHTDPEDGPAPDEAAAGEEGLPAQAPGGPSPEGDPQYLGPDG